MLTKAFTEMKLYLVFSSLNVLNDSEGCEVLEGYTKSGWQPTAQNLEIVAKLHELVTRDHQLTLKVTEDQLHINKESSLTF
jgi:hypothetical protein